MEDDQDEYFERMYADELEIMKEQEVEESAWIEEMANQYEENKGKEPRYKSKRSLDFSKCGGPENLSLDPTSQLSTNGDQVQIPVRTSRKRLPENPAEELSSTPSKRARVLSEEETVSAVAPSRKSRIPKNDFISVTGSDGTIVYVDVEDGSKKVPDVGRKTSQLLGTPLSVLKAQILEEVLLKENSSNLQSSELDAMTENGFTEADDDDEPRKNNPKLLWVDKYSPQSYSDLISEEATNRSLLKWLKLWDFTTFGIEPKMVEIQKEKSGRKIQKNFLRQGHSDLPLSDLDKNKRPVHKVALISGPPGFGKTTLAHIIAKHAGYNVVEMNASDDRAVEVFREKIEAATQMRAVLGDENPRPNCLVIDEIDGAPQPAIEVLIGMIKKSEPSVASNPSSKSTGRKKKDVTLLRPVICICNDLYVPALRQLRQMCFLVHFHAPHTSSLTGRLIEISRLENIKADTSALSTLCEKAENDIRSCINTLQFIKSKGSGELKADMVASVSLGQKDFQRNLFSNWISIFTLPKPVKPKYIDPNDREKVPEFWTMGKKAVTTSKRFRNILQLVSSSDEAKLHQGLFENYLSTNIKDPRMKKIGEAIDWLSDSDLLEVQISKRQDYSMMRYKPFVSVLFHLLFAVNRPNKIVFPKANFEFQSALSRSKEILLTFLQGCPASVQSCTSLEKSVLSIIPYMSYIIQPSLRPVNIHLYSAHEKNSLAQVVKTMMLHGLSYRQEKNEEGQFVYVLEPGIEKLLRFSDSKFQKTMSYSCRQMIAREIELERLRRSEGTETPRDSRTGKLQDVPKLKPKEMVQQKPVKDVKGPVDFFGRRIEKPPVSAVQEKDSSNDNQATPNIFGQVWYKYKEGFSNAVKRSCKVKDFL